MPFVPTEYNGMTVDSSNFIYVTTNAYSQNDYQAGKITPLRKLNAEGNDILVTGGTVRPYGDTAFVQTGSYRGASSLVDVCALPYGAYAVLDSNRGRFFVYNAGGELLFEAEARAGQRPVSGAGFHDLRRRSAVYSGFLQGDADAVCTERLRPTASAGGRVSREKPIRCRGGGVAVCSAGKPVQPDRADRPR